MTILLVRHAESEANAGHATNDPSSIKLTNLGVEQSIELSRSFAHCPDIIITSPFDRAVSTSIPLSRRYPLAHVEQWEIGEFTYLEPASCSNTTAEQRRARVNEYWESADPDYVDGPGAESFRSFFNRSANALECLMAIHGVVVVFGHGQVFQAMRLIAGNPGTQVNAQLMTRFRSLDLSDPIRNCQVIEINRPA